jgi:hypothetical protein
VLGRRGWLDRLRFGVVDYVVDYMFQSTAIDSGL